MDFSFVDSLTQGHIAAGDFPAAVVQVFNENEVLYSKAYRDASERTWFDMASVSKTVMLALMDALFAAGRLSPERPVLEVLPSACGPVLEVLPSACGPVTAERLRGVSPSPAPRPWSSPPTAI